MISGTLPLYSPGEELTANCSSANSFPAASLNWYINGQVGSSNLYECHNISKIIHNRLAVLMINVVFHSNKSDTSVIVQREIFEGLMPMLQVAPPRLLVPYNVTSSRLQLYTSTLGLRSVAISGYW